MKADALNPRELFGTTVHYEIPAFQRPYVWTLEDQWRPLWQDVRRVAEKVIAADGDEEMLEALGGHFLGAVVFKLKSAIAGDVTRQSVIDGQQRSTTLQIMLDAVHEAVLSRGHELEAEAIEELILNQAKRFAGRPERFKLWPSRSDRSAFEYAMDQTGAHTGDHLIVEAHEFFRTEVGDWLVGIVDEGEEAVGEEKDRVAALADVVQSRLYVVAINLTGHDDDQVIFETLNDRGTPLLKADLIKNWIFQIGERVHAGVDSWPEKYWADFDDTWWREEITQGRHMRSRIDIFLQYWLTMRRRSDVLTDEVFREFVAYAKPMMTTATDAEALLGELRRDADTFRSFAQLSRETVEGRFYGRVVESLELAATTPLLLWMLSENHSVPNDQISIALGALESWVIRRTLLRGTMKDVNKMMVAILAALDEVPIGEVGVAVRDYLVSQTSDARTWPSDVDMLAGLPGIKLYGNVRQSRLRVVLEALELQMRTQRHEAVTVPTKLSVEHVMPQAWRSHWDPEPKLSPEEAADRDRLVNTLGNLTLVTSELNGTLSHRPWTDIATAPLKTTGENKGLGKRSLLNKYSVLLLTREIVDHHAEAWTDEDIRARATQLSGVLCHVWPHPGSGTRSA
ncbi:DUF262 domain-containing protein [Allobranchiibius sp. CTAmp26]|uniref:DUF262 domain-containing protein n=1 Tax=Allobranchiibius sp. CTAmp26 TaxID=2815214 RepID=UPI001AA14FF8|nr:DUF262 domain-containing protein [Allobranchiibius sp. CTAmp26]MBO1753732.1 DUF262 domain-containing protein [Allobranchiibius sp. CTAmp26]